MSAPWATALAWLLTALVVAGAAYLAWMFMKKLGVTAEHHLARLGDRLKAWAATPFVSAGSAGRAAGQAGRQAWTDRVNQPDPEPSPATAARHERWEQTRPGRAAVRAEQGAARTGRAVGRWTGAGATAIGSGARAIPGGWREGVEHVRQARHRRTHGDDTVHTDPAAEPVTGPDGAQGPAHRGPDGAKGPAEPAESPAVEGPDGAESPDAEGPAAQGPEGPAAESPAVEGPDSTESVEGLAGTRVTTDGPAAGLPVETGPARTPYEQTLTPKQLEDYRRLKAIRDSGYDGPLDQDNRPVPGPQPAGEQGATETEGTGQAGAPDTKETDMAEVTEFTNTGDLRAEAEELENTAEELAEQLAEFHRRRELIEEKLGAAPFNTRAIASAASAVTDAKTIEAAQEALADLRRAIDESDALADVSSSLDAKGDVEAFATA